jgi:hypothetical protein
MIFLLGSPKERFFFNIPFPFLAVSVGYETRFNMRVILRFVACT